MKKVLLIPIILGSVLLVGGAIVFGIGASHSNPELQINTYDLAGQTFQNIEIDVHVADIEFIPCEEAEKRVECKETKSLYHTVEVRDETLHIATVDDRKWYENVFSFDLNPKKISVYLPSGDYTKIKITSRTGDLVLPASYACRDLELVATTGNISCKSRVDGHAKLMASTGNISVEDMNASRLYVEASTGDISIKGVTVEDDIESKASTGRIHLNNVRAKDLNVNASTGDIHLEDTVMSNHIEVKTSTGDITLEDVDAASLILTSTTGDIEGSLLSPKIFITKTTTGRIRVPDSTTGGTCRITTTTGNINIALKAA